ncbi:MAG: NAD+ synthase [Ktedonobacterales bacterium]|nr:NAD+ synthase [Ktedonobacterales bacterium]
MQCATIPHERISVHFTVWLIEEDSPVAPVLDRHLRLALAQINPSVGDLAGNTARIIRAITEAAAQSVQLLCLPEMALTGYPPEDLLLRAGFIRDTRHALADVIAATAAIPHMTVITGFVERAEDLYNAAAIIHAGQLVGTYHKHFLPNYGVFDENRYFAAGQEAPIYTISGVRVGVNICEDIWYPTGPATDQGYAGAEVLANISASPFHRGKRVGRERMLATRAADTGSFVAYVNLVGGQDELVFDGGSFIFDARGDLVARSPSFVEDMLIADLDIEGVFQQRLHDPRLRQARLDVEDQVRFYAVSPAPSGDAGPVAPRPASIALPQSDAEEVYAALVLGTRDYVVKNGFSHVVLGLSGGIDSALTAAIAVDALGAEAVHGVLMPSDYSSQGSLDDARELAANLGIATFELPIQSPVDAFMATLAGPLAEVPFGITQENVQSRTRGVLLMALSNAFGWLVLTTGNKSEMAVGYATLYGDMAGGFAVLKDVWKTLVYQLAVARNDRAGRPLIPVNTIEKPPSAELRPDQRDTDSLPPYDVLDPILAAYVEDDLGQSAIVARGYSPDVVQRVLRLVDRSEYKRRQSAPGVKVTLRAFGRDRRLPLTSGYHDWSA